MRNIDNTWKGLAFFSTAIRYLLSFFPSGQLYFLFMSSFPDPWLGQAQDKVYRQEPEEAGEEAREAAGEAAGDNLCHLSAYNRRLREQSPNYAIEEVSIQYVIRCFQFESVTVSVVCSTCLLVRYLSEASRTFHTSAK